MPATPAATKFVGSGDSSVVDNGIEYVDANGQLHPGAVDVISYIATKHPEVVLCTGHGTAREVDAVVRKAVELGVPKICVNHPHFLVNATYEQMREWADLGAYIELNAAVFSSIAKSLAPVPRNWPARMTGDQFPPKKSCWTPVSDRR